MEERGGGREEGLRDRGGGRGEEGGWGGQMGWLGKGSGDEDGDGGRLRVTSSIRNEICSRSEACDLAGNIDGLSAEVI